MSSRYRQQLEDVVRTVLLAPPDLSNTALARQVGRTRQMVSQIRLGRRCENILPELPRADLEQATRTCLTCRLFHHAPYLKRDPMDQRHIHGQCTVGYPEAFENHKWARSCEAYAK